MGRVCNLSDGLAHRLGLPNPVLVKNRWLWQNITGVLSNHFWSKLKDVGFSKQDLSARECPDHSELQNVQHSHALHRPHSSWSKQLRLSATNTCRQRHVLNAWWKRRHGHIQFRLQNVLVEVPRRRRPVSYTARRRVKRRSFWHFAKWSFRMPTVRQHTILQLFGWAILKH